MFLYKGMKDKTIKATVYFQSILYVKKFFFGHKFCAKMVAKHGR